MFGVLWQPGVRSTTASDPTARWTIAHRRSSDSPSKGAGPWPGSLRQPQPSTQLRNSSYEWLRNRGQVTTATVIHNVSNDKVDCHGRDCSYTECSQRLASICATLRCCC